MNWTLARLRKRLNDQRKRFIDKGNEPFNNGAAWAFGTALMYVGWVERGVPYVPIPSGTIPSDLWGLGELSEYGNPPIRERPELRQMMESARWSPIDLRPGLIGMALFGSLVGLAVGLISGALLWGHVG